MKKCKVCEAFLLTTAPADAIGSRRFWEYDLNGYCSSTCLESVRLYLHGTDYEPRGGAKYPMTPQDRENIRQQYNIPVENAILNWNRTQGAVHD